MSEWRMCTKCAHRTQLSAEGSCLLLTGSACEGRLRPGTQLSTGAGPQPIRPPAPIPSLGLSTSQRGSSSAAASAASRKPARLSFPESVPIDVALGPEPESK
ncbi:unnamed protein product [Rangifer tarandus platyrhynchus]|uniref:Uncharacterized protein n=1 Tax=Rangifer tarandus platyrhynchus TaxID=3082113 RepID=A0AC59YSQ1_RANTA